MRSHAQPLGILIAKSADRLIAGRHGLNAPLAPPTPTCDGELKTCADTLDKIQAGVNIRDGGIVVNHILDGDVHLLDNVLDRFGSFAPKVETQAR